MRPRRHRIARLEQRKLPPHRPLLQIELHHLARIPQRHKRPRPILRHRQRHRIRPRHRIALRQIEPLSTPAPSPHPSAAHRPKDCPPPATSVRIHATSPCRHHRNRRRKRHRPSSPPPATHQHRPPPPASFCSGIGIIRSGVIFPSHRSCTPPRHSPVLRPCPSPRLGFAQSRRHARVHMLPIRAERQPRIQRLLRSSTPSGHRENPSPSPSAYPSPPATGRTSTRTSHTPHSPSPHSAHPATPPSTSAANSTAADSPAPRPICLLEGRFDPPASSCAPLPSSATPDHTTKHYRHNATQLRPA